MSLHGRSLMAAPPADDRGDAPALDKIPVGVWLRVHLPKQPPLVGFTYLDRREGLSLQGYPQRGDAIHRSGRIVLRLPLPGVDWEPLSAEEVRRFSLDRAPGWVEQLYGPQPATGTLWGVWRDHPKLRRLLSEERIDEVQVVVHDGGPLFACDPPEPLWVRLTGVDGDVFLGTLVESPRRLRGVRHLDDVRFVVPDDGRPPLLVTEKYLQERSEWIVIPCSDCGLTELYDAPSDLRPEAGQDGTAALRFAVECGACGGKQEVRHVSIGDVAETPRKWWRLWA